MPFQHLRRVASYVDEPRQGQYFWVIIESVEDGSVWEELKGSDKIYESWLQAHEAGNAELLKLVENKATGPLAFGEDEGINPVG